MNSERTGTRCQDAPDTVLVTGYSTAPTGTSMHAVYRHCGVVLEVDVSSHRVVHADFTVLTGLANDFLRRLVVGFDMSRDPDAVFEAMRQRYLAPSQQAMVVAFRAAWQRYQERVHPADPLGQGSDDPRLHLTSRPSV